MGGAQEDLSTHGYTQPETVNATPTMRITDDCEVEWNEDSNGIMTLYGYRVRGNQTVKNGRQSTEMDWEDYQLMSPTNQEFKVPQSEFLTFEPPGSNSNDVSYINEEDEG